VSGAAIANLEVETLQHKFPTFHGDTIHAETRVLEVKESSSVRDCSADCRRECRPVRE
jgi:acyl dehydratase